MLFLIALLMAFLFGVAWGMSIANERPYEDITGLETEQDAFERWYTETFQE